MHLLQGKEIDSEADVAVYPYQTYCTSKYETVWTGMTYGYKGFLLLFCTCLAWETRKVYMPALNDSKQIGFAVYNVFIPCSIIIPLLNLLKSNSNAVYTLSALLCIFCTTITQCLIFLPKIVVMVSTKGEPSNYEKGLNFSSSVNNETPSIDSKVVPASMEGEKSREKTEKYIADEGNELPLPP